MKTFNHVGSELQDLRTENIEGKRHYVTPDGISTYLLPHFYQTSPKLVYRSGEQGLEKWRPTEYQPKPLDKEPAYILSVSPISKTKTDF